MIPFLGELATKSLGMAFLQEQYDRNTVGVDRFSMIPALEKFYSITIIIMTIIITIL